MQPQSQCWKSTTRLMLVLSGLLLSTACVGERNLPPIRLAANCSKLIPTSYRQATPATPIPATDGLSLLDQVKAWAGAYVGMAGQLSKANGRTTDTIEIVENCERLVNGE